MLAEPHAAWVDAGAGSGCAATVPTDLALRGDGRRSFCHTPPPPKELVGAALPAHWRARRPAALAAALVSTLLSVSGALLIAPSGLQALAWRPSAAAAGDSRHGDGLAALFTGGSGSGYRFLTPPVDRWHQAQATMRAPLFFVGAIWPAGRPRRPGDVRLRAATAAGSACVGWCCHA